MGPANELQSAVINLAAGTLGYCEPKYAMTHTLTKESDVYSFGVVLFEILCGRLCYTHSDGRVQEILVPTWTEKYEQKKLDDIIFKHPTPDQMMDKRALATFSDIAFQCLEKRREDRPKMAEVVTKLAAALRYQEAYDSLVQIKFLQAYRGLTIQLKEITSATNNFDDLNCIGEGDFGKVYKGEVFHSDGRSMVALRNSTFDTTCNNPATTAP
ncbi:putative receptor-like protein kinase At5g38990 [Bidens hawaiensis]|uniref:putative receptor-like protein kinase At5g38990 n=1 Tax=Bidens hawaiensis TaxID=980011 RepID=UPI00404B0C80